MSSRLWAGATGGASVPFLYLLWSPYAPLLAMLGALVGALTAFAAARQLAQLTAKTSMGQGFVQGAAAGALGGLSYWTLLSLLYGVFYVHGL